MHDGEGAPRKCRWVAQVETGNRLRNREFNDVKTRILSNCNFRQPSKRPLGGTSRGSKQNAVRRISRTHTYIMSSYLRTHIPTRDADCVAFGQTHRRHLPPTSNHFPSMATFPRTGTLPYACPSTTPSRIPHSSGFESGE